MRALVHAEIDANAVPGAVIVIEPSFPQAHARQRIELMAARAFRKTHARECDVAFEDTREAILHLRRGAADRYRARDVGGAVEILSAAIDQEERTACKAPVGLGRDAIVHDRAVRPSAGDRVEREIFESARFGAEGFELLAGVDLLHLAALSLRRQPVQKARHRRAVTRVRLARTFNLRGVLAGARQHHRIGPPQDLRASRFQFFEVPGARRRRIELHLLAGQRAQRWLQFLARLHGHLVAQPLAQLRRDFFVSQEQISRPVRTQQRFAQRERRARHVAAAHIEEPRD